MSRWLAYVVGLGTVVATASPAFFPDQPDSYPLSTYPMFSRPRDKPTVFFVEGLDAAGEGVRLPSALVASQEVMQTAVTVRRAIQAGEPAISELCAEVARRVAASREHAQVRAVRLVSARFDPVRYFTVGRAPESLTEHRRCSVGSER